MDLDGPVIGELVPMVTADLVTVLDDLAPCTIVAHDPPWSSIADRARPPARLVAPGSMERATLDGLVASEPPTDAPVVGIGGGTAIDTAKYLAWCTGRRLVLAPTVLSVDAAFTAEIGVRVDRRVQYVGAVTPELVVIDHPLIRAAPVRLNRAGAGDVVSCHTALDDWRRARAAGVSGAQPWRDDLAALGRALLATVRDAADDIRAVTTDGVAVLAEALRRIGAACRAAGHARFEEGSEHFLAYCYEHATGARHVHGELVALTTVAMAVVQDNAPDDIAHLVARTGVRADPDALGITRDEFEQALTNLAGYGRAEQLWYSVADEVTITPRVVDAAWRAVSALRTS